MNRAASILASAAAVFLAAAPLGADSLAEQARRILQGRVALAGEPPKVQIGGREMHVSEMLPSFYARREFRLAWSDGFEPLFHADVLINSLDGAGAEGLRPEFYRTDQGKAALEEVRRKVREGEPPAPELLADMDLLLTDAFLAYGFDLLTGRVNPASIEGEWADNDWEADLQGLLNSALELGMVGEALENLNPPHHSFAGLKQALAVYRGIAEAGGWNAVPSDAMLEKGDRGWRVGLLRARLLVTDGAGQGPRDGEVLFDETMEQAVLGFQRRHGLRADGMVGPNTIEALNVPVEKRIRRIELNMERWRWLPQDFGEHYIVVNSAGFQMKLFENDVPVMSMRVVVGEPYWHTPNFSALMTYIVLNPSWNVTKKIAVREMLPKIRKDPGYLMKQGFNIYRDDEEIDPESIDWESVPEDGFNFKFVQPPGPLNPLGRIKFMFPNRFAVYLHDTPSKGLFSAPVRTFSHGCIRIEKPVELAKYLLREDPDWTHERLLAAIEEGEERTIRLPHPETIHLLYWTAWVEEDGTVQFRDDVYGRDKLLDEKLFMEAPTPLLP